MSNTQLLFAAASVAVALIFALWGIAERNTTRLIEQLEKRMVERDEKLSAKIDGLRGEVLAKFEGMQTQLSGLQLQINGLRDEVRDLKTQNAQRGALEKEVGALAARVEQLEKRRAA